MKWVYLDNNATTQPAPQVVAAMQETHDQLWANPSSVHRFGQMVRQRIELARASVGRLIGTRDRNIVFTSGGTESNNLALRGLWDMVVKGGGQPGSCSRRVLITTKIEHAAIREPAEMLSKSGVDVLYLPVDISGRVDPKELQKTLEQQVQQDPALVSIQWCNNETGVIQPIAALVDTARAFDGRVRFHTDATQAVGKIPVDVSQVPVDFMTFSAHKFHGPKGVGMLYIRSGVRLRAQNLGGPHERERRGGTENAAGIIAAGVASDLATVFLADPALAAAQAARRDRFEREVRRQVPTAVIHSRGTGPEDRLWNTSNIGFPHLEAEAILLGLSERGLCASAGAACSSGSLEPSPVLLAMNIPEPVAHGSIRFSLSRFTTDDEINPATVIVPQVVQRLAKTMPLGI